MPRKATKKKWQRPILRIRRKSEDERRLERAGLSSLPCPIPANTPGRCYKRPASSPGKN
jgi:hypothetical protein